MTKIDMIKQDWTMKIFKADKRTLTGDRLISSTIWRDRDIGSLCREIDELKSLYPAKKGYRFEYYPAKKTVKNLMTGQDVVIDSDTPWCCDPSSEVYWSY